jgi:RNA-directed DNA polymerase
MPRSTHLVVTARTKEQLEALKPIIAQWLLERGLVMNEEKTKIVPVQTGFDFLGFSIRHYQTKCLVKPAKKKVLAHLQFIRQWLKDHRQVEASAVVRYLNTRLLGWTQYYRCASSSETFSYVKHQIWSALWKWCKRRHPNKSQNWIKRKYFRTEAGRDWRFFAETTDEHGERNAHYLIDISLIRIERHTKVRGAASPDDPQLVDYWNARRQPRGSKRLAAPGAVSNTVRRMLGA